MHLSLNHATTYAFDSLTHYSNTLPSLPPLFLVLQILRTRQASRTVLRYTKNEQPHHHCMVTSLMHLSNEVLVVRIQCVISLYCMRLYKHQVDALPMVSCLENIVIYLKRNSRATIRLTADQQVRGSNPRTSFPST